MVFLVCLLSLAVHFTVNVLGTQTYIVQMNPSLKPSSFATHYEWHTANLLSFSSDPLLYSYSTVYNGFAASLEPEQAESLRQSDSVLGVYEDTLYSLHTTRTPKFLGLENDLRYPGPGTMKNLSEASMDVIIGFLDTGVWPEPESFDDSNMKPVPTRWKGKCESGVHFSPSLCNRKLIGARSFSKGIRAAYKDHSDVITNSPRDENGHGTHVASIAAGSRVANASLFGYARGTARGMATGARIAVYKVCWKYGCSGSDVLAAMDSAILDGANVLSISISFAIADYFQDVIAIGAFSAVDKGIFVSCSAGNGGPAFASVLNVAPWISTVGAGTIDRSFPAFALLGDGRKFAGSSLYSGTSTSEPLSLVYHNRNSSGQKCLSGSLEPSWVRGKVVLCDRGINDHVAKGAVVRDAGGFGMILLNAADNGEESYADSHLLPALAVGELAGDVIRAYVQADPNPTAMLSFGGTILDVKPAPMVAGFSSRGPNPVTPHILKPDLIAPGVNILAAWTESAAPTGLESDSRRAQFNIMSGTSMSCPHISGLAALLKAAHPKWSPSYIKSALMTTAYTVDNTNSPFLDAATNTISTPWAHGSGHVDINKALDPGLVYSIKTSDYIKFLCSLDYTISQVKAIAKRPDVTCSQRFADPGRLNYPSFAIFFTNKSTVQYTRVLTNVGQEMSVYNVTVTGPAEVRVTVKPTILVFRKAGQQVKYKISFTAKTGTSYGEKFGSVIWRSEQHEVQSPISYLWGRP